MLKLGTLMENDHYIMILLFITIQCNTYCHLTTILHKRKKDKDNLINPKTYIYLNDTISIKQLDNRRLHTDLYFCTVSRRVPDNKNSQLILVVPSVNRLSNEFHNN